LQKNGTIQDKQKKKVGLRKKNLQRRGKGCTVTGRKSLKHAIVEKKSIEEKKLIG